MSARSWIALSALLVLLLLAVLGWVARDSLEACDPYGCGPGGIALVACAGAMAILAAVFFWLLVAWLWLWYQERTG